MNLDVSKIDPQTRRALAAFEGFMRKRYGVRFSGLVLFGSRARGDHRPDSDADVAVFIDTSDDPIHEQMDIAEDAYRVFLDTGILVQPWVFTGQPGIPETSVAAGLRRVVEEEGVLL
jgi:predicted nucleotidyltransferase